MFLTLFLIFNQAIQEGNRSVELEEEKRLCYVAMTRAKTELLMTWRKEVPIFTKEGVRTVKKARSRFLDVLVKKAVKGSDASKEDDGKRKGDKKTTGTSHVFRKSSTLEEGRRQRSTQQLVRPQEATPRRSSPYLNKGRVEKSPKARTSSQLDRRSLYDFSARLPSSSSSYDEPPATHKQTSKPLYDLTATLPVKDTPSYSQPTPIKNSSTVKPSRSSTSNKVATNASHRSAPYAKVASNPSPPSSSPTQTKKEAKSVDSTWFYPVGSVVTHKKFGRGVVVESGPSSANNLGVLVHFDSGDKKEFCATGNEISLALT